MQAAARNLQKENGLAESDEEGDDKFGGEVRRSAPQVVMADNVITS